MTTLAKARLNSIFPIDRKGDTLVIAPQGDAIGFSPSQLQVEVRGLEKIFDTPQSTHLIVDLEHTNYFGSEMIGLISRIGVKARQRGGRTAMCNISADMQGIFDVMNFDVIWEMYDTKRDALKAVAKIPIGERVAQYRKPACFAMVMILLAVGVSYFPWPDKSRDHYKLFMTYANEIHDMRKVSQGDTQRSGFRKRVERDLRPILKELSAKSEEGDAASTYLFVAGKKCLLPLLTADGTDRAQLERDFAVNMSEASKYIENVSPPGEEFAAEQPQGPASRVLRTARITPRSSPTRHE